MKNYNSYLAIGLLSLLPLFTFALQSPALSNIGVNVIDNSNANKWYTSATINLKNQTGQAIDTSGLSIQFSSNTAVSFYNNQTMTPANGVYNNGGSASFNNNIMQITPVFAGPWNNAIGGPGKAMWANGATISFSIGVNTNGIAYNLAQVRSSLKVFVNNAPAPVPDPVPPVLYNATVNLQGLPGTAPVTVSLQGSNNYTVAVTPGMPAAVKLTAATYVVSAPTVLVNGVNYSAANQSVIINGDGVVININYLGQIIPTPPVPPVPGKGGRMISYLPAWSALPAPATLASKGYTHMLVAFGLLSTTNPGQVVFPSTWNITPAYISQLHAQNIKVLLSIGGSSSSIPNTTVNFDQVFKASNAVAFQAQMVSSIQALMSQYGFDGIDVDFEQGFSPGAGGTFTNPGGSLAAMANVINTLHANNPTILISLVPQAANIGATSGFDATWGNYSALIMQTYASLSWVGIQLYNTGCVYGIDHVCYANNGGNDQNFSVAMAVDLLASWPQTDSTGRATGFQPYISYLRPDQIVLGYPAPNASGVSDGLPVTNAAGIKAALNCLQTKLTCGSYVPAKTYPGIGGVFNWEITYDQANNYKFATDLTQCVIGGIC